MIPHSLFSTITGFWDTLRLLSATEIRCNRAVYVSLNTDAVFE